MATRKNTRTAKQQSSPSPEAIAIAKRVNALPAAAQRELARIVAKAPSRNRSTAPAVAAPIPGDPSTWPIVWRVVSPAAGSYDRDMVYIETESETEARARYAVTREAKLPARLERVSCGPGATMPEILGHWEAR
ncbi:MAG TPA: hypothetical protein VGR92_06025 [Steroidobacteraceae bacterium]|nr:hypothetical protein [Steroidobacteraceae bacterium]